MGIFYQYCKINTRLISHLFYRNIRVSGLEHIPANKPVLLAVNHPNSFLDAVLVGAAINRPTHFLARGDAFGNKWVLPILNSLNMLPVYRLSEGKENLNKNTHTFDACQNILEQKKVVLIFAEGLSENNWHLRSMKKGTARIAMKAWNSQTPANELEIVPVGITYEQYGKAGKTILINIGKSFSKNLIHDINNEALQVKKFNETVSESLAELAYINPHLTEGQKEHKHFRENLQFLSAKEKSVSHILKKLNTEDIAGRSLKEYNFMKSSLIFYPLYLFSFWLTPKIIKQKLFFDSISFGLVLFLWPLYLLLIGAFVYGVNALIHY